MKKLGFLLVLIMLLLCSCLSENIPFFSSQTTGATTTQDGTPEETAPDETKPTEAPHEHVFGNGVITKEPTCGGTGELTETCSCGAIRITEIHAPIAHTYGNEIVIKEPTCSKAGEGCIICSVCGDTQLKIIRATGIHIYENAVCLGCGESIFKL